MTKMKHPSYKIMMFILMGVLCLSASSVYAETAEEYYNRGVTYYKQRNFTQAVSDFTKAVEIDPKYADAYNNRGNIYNDRGDFAQAISDFTKVIEINPNDATGYYNRGGAYYMAKEYDEAWQDVHKAEGLGIAVDLEFLSHLKKDSGREK